MVQQTFFGRTADYRRPRSPTIEQSGSRPNVKSSLGRGAAVTFRATRLEDRKNLFFKCERDGSGRGCSILRQCDYRPKSH